MKNNNTSEKIIDCALELLKSQGDRGVTIRQVAAKAGISHSNVQYYFKNKDALLLAVANRYFEQCLSEMRVLPEVSAMSCVTDGHRESLEHFIRAFLVHGLEISEMCRIFREYWAIACRNDKIHDYLQQYYQQYAATVANKLRPICREEARLSKAVAIFVPMVEGYSITANALPEDLNKVTATLTTLLLELIQE